VNVQELKKAAGERAAGFVEDGMVVGMGTGSTVYFTIQALGRRVGDGLSIRAVSTSEETSGLCSELGIPLVSLDDVDRVDLTIDGADEVDPGLEGIKGGHGALLREKIVALNSRRNIWVVDQRKLVDALVRDTVPLEVIEIGVVQLQAALAKRGYPSEIRMENGRRFHTDQNNLILDLKPGRVEDLRKAEREWNAMTGGVECGLFLGGADMVIVAGNDGVTIRERP